jgi:hypothetical protein
MKRELKTGSRGNPSGRLSDQFAAARVQADRAAAKRREELTTMWRASLICGFAIIAVFVTLEVLQPSPDEPKAAAVDTGTCRSAGRDRCQSQ